MQDLVQEVLVQEVLVQEVLVLALGLLTDCTASNTHFVSHKSSP
jgi:hypothetical protein